MFLLILFAVFAVPSVWAQLYDYPITYNGEGIITPCSGSYGVHIDPSHPEVTNFYIHDDDGGDGGYYSNNCNGKRVITAPKGYGIKVSGWVMAETVDYLQITNGLSTTEVIANVKGSGVDTQKNFGPYYSTGNEMTVSFITDASVVGPGLLLHVEIVPLRTVTIQENPMSTQTANMVIWRPYYNVSYGYSYSEKSVSFPQGMKVSLGFSRSWQKQYLWGLNVKNLVTGELLDVTTVADSMLFTLPAGDVVVMPTYRTDDIFKMAKGQKTIELSSNSSITLYDDGGADYHYANNFDGYVTVVAPEDQQVMVSGTVKTEKGGYDYLKIYEGEGTSTTPKCNFYSTANKETVNIGLDECVSDGRKLTFHFHSDYSDTASGLELTVSAVGLTHSISLIQTSNGTIESDVSSARTGTLVTLTATPNSGFILKDVRVVNTKTKEVVATSGGWETNNKVTFTMPQGDVEVTPTFVTNTYSILRDPATSGGSISGASAATVGSRVSLTANPSTGYLFKGVSVVDANGNPLSVSGGNGFLDRTFSFTMPIGNVTVKPVWTDDLTVSGGHYINIPKSGTNYVTLPKDLQSFNVYDDGGKNGNYSNNSNGTLVLTAPTGSVLELSGTLTTNYTRSQTDKCLSGELWDGFYVCNQYAYTYSCDMDDNLSIYDGSSNAAASLLQGKIGCSSSDNSVSLGASVGIIRSSGNTMTLNFKSGYNGASSGLNLTVKIISDTYNVSIEASNNGSVSSDKNKAKIGSTVTLTAHPQSGYLLKNIQVKDASGNLVKLDKNNFTSWTFAMPPSDVTVTSTFTKELTVAGGLYIDIPNTGSVEVAIPEGVKSFKVYDDGSKDGNYSNNSNGTLVLTAPNGYVLELSGMLTTNYTSAQSDKCLSGELWDGFYVCNQYAYTYSCDMDDNLSVYDGSSNAAVSLLQGKIGCSSSDNSVSTGASIGKIMSSGPKMALNFKSGSSGNSSGLDLTVTLRKLEMELEDDGNGGKYVNMLVKNTAKLTIPKEVTSFKIYDDGGKDGLYSNNSNGTLVLTAPDGYVLELTGTVNTSFITSSQCTSVSGYDGSCEHFEYSYSCDTYDNLSVYDGTNNAATSLLEGLVGCNSSGSSVSTGVSVGKIMSSGQEMALNFKSGSSGNSSGLDLTVTLRKLEMELEDDGNGGKYVNMLTNSIATLSIPKGIKSFKIYDDGGKNGDYSNNNKGSLVLLAPSSEYVLELTGTITTNSTSTPSKCISGESWDGFFVCSQYSYTYSCDTYDNLNVYDGTDNSSTPLLQGMMGCNSSGVSTMLSVGTIRSSGNTMTLNFMSGASGTSKGLDLTVTLIKPNANMAVEDIASQTYTGSAICPEVVVKDEDAVLVKNTDYTVTCSDNINVGMATAMITGIGVYAGEVEKTFEITPKSIDGLEFVYEKNWTYTGSAIFPDLAVKDGEKELSRVIDYTAKYGFGAANAGTKKIVVTGKGNYTGNIDLPYKIAPKEISVAWGEQTIFAYNGESQLPTATAVGLLGDDQCEIYVSSKIYFEEDDVWDWEDSYAGEHIAVALDLSNNNYKLPETGIEKSFTITPKSLTSQDIELVYEEKQPYTGSAVCPKVVVKDGGNTVYAVYNYTVSCIDNVSLSGQKGTFIVKGKGNYTGELSGSFTIIPKVVNDFAAVTIEQDENGTFAVIDGNYSGTDVVEIKNEIKDVPVVYNRSFPANAYSTIMLPFDVNTANIEGPDAVLRYNGIKTVNNVSSIRMKVVWATDKWVVANGIKDANDNYKQYPDENLSANTPYLVQMGDATSEDGKTVALKVNGTVTIKKTTDSDVTLDKWTFRGTWQYKRWDANDDELGYAYGFAASASETNNIKVGDFVKVGAGAWIRPMRAYLVKAELPKKAAQLARANGAYVMRPTVVPEELPELMSIVIDGDDDNEEHTTVIGHFNTRTGEIKMNYDRGKFDLKGRRVNGSNNARGAYYGKKILKK
jgi:hypothetical protein